MPSRPPLHRILSPHKIRDLQDLVLRVPTADHVIQFAVDLVRFQSDPRDATYGTAFRAADEAC